MSWPPHSDKSCSSAASCGRAKFKPLTLRSPHRKTANQENPPCQTLIQHPTQQRGSGVPQPCTAAPGLPWGWPVLDWVLRGGFTSRALESPWKCAITSGAGEKLPTAPKHHVKTLGKSSPLQKGLLCFRAGARAWPSCRGPLLRSCLGNGAGEMGWDRRGPWVTAGWHPVTGWRSRATPNLDVHLWAQNTPVLCFENLCCSSTFCKLCSDASFDFERCSCACMQKSISILTLGSSCMELSILEVLLLTAISERAVTGTNAGCFPEVFCLWFGCYIPKGGCFVLLLCCHCPVASLAFVQASCFFPQATPSSGSLQIFSTSLEQGHF